MLLAKILNLRSESMTLSVFVLNQIYFLSSLVLCFNYPGNLTVKTCVSTRVSAFIFPFHSKNLVSSNPKTTNCYLLLHLKNISCNRRNTL